MLSRARLVSITILIGVILVMIYIMAVSIVEISLSSFILPMTLIITIGIMLSCVVLILIIVTRPKKIKSQIILFQMIPTVCPACGIKLPKDSKKGTVCGFCGKVIY